MRKGISLLFVFIISLNLFISPAYATELNEIKDTNRLTKIVRGIGEKMGVKWTATSLGTAVKYIAGGAVGLVIPDWWLFGTVPDTIPYEQDPSLWRLTPEDFDIGVEAIKKAGIELKDGSEVILYDVCEMGKFRTSSSATIYTYDRAWARFTDSTTTTEWLQVADSTNTFKPTWYTHENGMQYTREQMSFRQYYKEKTDDYWTLQTTTYQVMGGGAIHVHGYGDPLSNCLKPITIADEIDMSSVHNDFITNNYNIYNITIVTSDDNSDPTIPLNEPYQPEETQPTPEPEEKPVGASWWEWLLAPLKAIGDAIAGLASLLTSLFVPSEGSIDGLFNGLHDKFMAKLPLIEQLGGFFDTVESVNTADPTVPEFKVDIPVEWGGGAFNIIDFSMFTQYREWVLNIIRFIAWFVFLKRLYGRIPKMVY